MRTQEEVIGEIRRQRDELVSAVADTRRDVLRQTEHLKTMARRPVPILGAVVGVVVVALVARTLGRSPRKSAGAIERVRVGRYSLVEHL